MSRLFYKQWWRRIWYEHISSRLRPRNKWLTKQIPRVWLDKDHLLEICILGALKHYCEESGEDCFNILCCDNPPEQAEFMRELKHNYELATQKLVALQKELAAEWDAIPPVDWKDLNRGTKGDYDRKYGKIARLEQEIYDLQTEIMVWVVKHRNGLWT
jgi:hypothetical protein